MAVCSLPDCSKRRHSAGLCWRHLEESRAAHGDLCAVEGCRRGRFYRGRCGRHATSSSRAEHGRKDSTYTITCEHCGRDGQVTRRHVRYCTNACAKRAQSAAARAQYLPVLHPDPSPLTHLPAKHPAMQPAPPRGCQDWWKMLVAGPCAWCSEPFVAVAAAYETRTLYCSKRCQRNATQLRHGRFRIPPDVRLAIYERDGWTCQLCREAVDPDLPPSHVWAATLDHVVPQSWTLIPDHRPENLRLAHRWCNSVRNDERYHTADVLVAP